MRNKITTHAMKRIHVGLFTNLMLPLIVIPLTLFIPGHKFYALIESMPTLLVLLMSIGSVLIILTAVKSNRIEGEEYENKFFRKLLIAGSLWLISSILSLLKLLILTQTEELIVLSGLVNAASYVIYAFAFGDLAGQSGLRGASMTSKGFWGIVLALMMMLLAMLGQSGGGHYYTDYSSDNIFYRSAIMIIAVLIILASLFAIIYGCSFLIGSVREVEESVADDEYEESYAGTSE